MSLAYRDQKEQERYGYYNLDNRKVDSNVEFAKLSFCLDNQKIKVCKITSIGRTGYCFYFDNNSASLSYGNIGALRTNTGSHKPKTWSITCYSDQIQEASETIVSEVIKYKMYLQSQADLIFIPEPL